MTYGASGIGWKPNQVEALQNDKIHQEEINNGYFFTFCRYH